jgi:hypothetical protein
MKDKNEYGYPDERLDMSCFPLLRIDQLHLHKSEILLKSQGFLAQLIKDEDNQVIQEYGNRLLKMIQIEISRRNISPLLLSRSWRVNAHWWPSTTTVTSLSDLQLKHDLVQSRMEDDSNVRRNFIENSVEEKWWDQKPVRCFPIPSTHNYYVAFNNSMKNGGFKARAKARTLSLKARQLNDADQYEMEIIHKNKEMRRKLAQERMFAREARKRDLVIKRLQLKQQKEESKAKLIQEMKHEVQTDMEMVAKSLIRELEKESHSDKEIIHIDAAAAATTVMQNSEIDVLASDSGSSLASEVDLFSDVESICSENENEEVFDTTCSITFEYQKESANDNDNTCYKNSIVTMQNEAQEIKQQDKPKTEILRVQSDTCLKNEECKMQNSVERDSELCSDDKAIMSAPSMNPCCNDEQIEWRPWSEMREMNVEIHHTVAESAEGGRMFTDILPSFRSIFTAFVSSGMDPLLDRNQFVERECLQYQIKALSLMSGVSKDHIFANKLFFATKTNRLEVNTIIDDVMMNFSDRDSPWENLSFGSGNCWNLLWTWKKPKINPNHLLFCQKISRFQNTSFLTRKDYLKKQIQRVCSTLQNRFKNSWNIMPLTFVLPTEFTLFLSTFSNIQKAKKAEDSNIWIMKPVGMSRGRGITLINDISKVTYSSPTVIQQYLSNPLLFEHYKFDLRLYILVTSFSPLEAFIYEEGFARFSSQKFGLHGDSIGNEQIHLTNSSIQKKYDNDIHLSHPARLAGIDGGGNKVRLSWLWEQLRQQGYQVHQIQQNVKDLCLKALIIGGEDIPFQPNSFELFGFDVIIDKEGKPWLIEVNACPCLARENDLDVTVKEALIEDTFKIVSPPKFNRQVLSDICKRRLNQRKQGSNSLQVSERYVLEKDLRSIFGNELPRQYGEDPRQKTKYERLAPGKAYEMLMKQRGLEVIYPQL